MAALSCSPGVNLGSYDDFGTEVDATPVHIHSSEGHILFRLNPFFSPPLYTVIVIFNL